MDELFFSNVKVPQAGKLDSSSILTLQDVHFMGQPLLNTEVPNFDHNPRASALPQIRAFDPNNHRQSLDLPLSPHKRVYRKSTAPSGNVPPIRYSRTLYRKSDYSAYNKQLPQMPTIWPVDRVVSQSGLFITPPQSPAESVPTPLQELESTSIQRNFSRKLTKQEMKQCQSHLPVLQRARTVQSESAEIQSRLSTPVSAFSEADRASLNLLATSLKRSLSPPSPLQEGKSSLQ